jgi:hypothetical protein
MNAMYLPAAPEILDAFEHEVRELGGTVRDVYAEGDLLFARAILPDEMEVRPGDRVHGGVAVRSHDTEILVHPYTYRVVCTNGAINVSALGSRVVQRVELAAPTIVINGVLHDLREAIHASGSPTALQNTVSAMRSAAEREADVMIQLMSVLPHMPPGVRASVLRTIVRRFEAEGDRSALGLVNALTSVARDTSDPELRWRLEEVGGGMLAYLPELRRPVVAGLEVFETTARPTAQVASR